ncbi:cytochrome C oxidase subunit IV family protein [Roseiconus lacunae]|uniref:Cytochrome C oxidase subunit IV family protein n=1 Tax=Roseiconus lacunae TaxID=2605694 RepID=A0ABT7PQC5_9BACT|nr:cytochrome C oxidase subunit IV family protein [Roseiconus lacunae]MCD0463199.1 cytochrome C oxidase subunit IV family protein [Roseiconus lacunae]MDM4018704.1 cytochrome C oxidase subunit IV family protein [Roseiconus lacunae]WRQ48601.1 cytochrome C oxidase subunit IV family protein [Stieleria sp. HD01]
MSAHEGSREGYDFAHPLPLPLLFGVFVALTVLTVITVFQANFDLGSYDIIVVMIIASIKALLVGAFFMHLAFDKPMNVIWFTGSFVFVALFIIFTLFDNRASHKDDIPVLNDTVAAASAEG